MMLVRPTREYLAGYVAALKRGWSPDNMREAARLEELEWIQKDPVSFLESLEDRRAKAGPVRLPDGSFVKRLPGIHRWMWDGEFAGDIGFRWQPGTPVLPPTCLGHIGYSVVPWKRNHGYATEALRLILPEAQKEGLPYVEITTDEDNVASQRVIIANGGTLVEKFNKGPAYGNAEGLRFRIYVRQQ